ncbi:uncharacterized protein BX664DRAFT_323439 [Halteromyces radiatus]|uniref:uncharacterized protein n=1 Tax=Halteromyces radiatus TaxID=101107 RepID=UPI002220E4C3|nr:uncharacterized protein BX664DRAFT_323439 [Halteromyces radiatus]KAI8096239.1 hypothetical protein BX664DRAFT_323439 [Halteromyces radiatus]
MSSFTTLSVNKNTARFTPKVKQRGRRRPSLQSIHDDVPSITPSTTQTTVSSPPSTSSLPTHSVNAQPALTKKPIKAAATQAKEISKATTSRSSNTSIKTAPFQRIQAPSKGDHATVSIPLDRQQTNLKSTTSMPTINTSMASPPTSPVTANPLKKRRRTNKHDLPSPSLMTLDDITHDPADPSFMQKPLSYFTEDLPTGIVSRQYKESQLKEQSSRQSTSVTKKKIQPSQPPPSSSSSSSRTSETERPRLMESANAPQVQLVNGEIVLDTSSLYIDRPLGRREEMDYEVVEEDSMTTQVNSHSYGKQHERHGRKWSNQEKDQFYQGLARYGTDFDLIATLIPTRSRKEIKLMFNRQEKKCPWRISHCIMQKSSSEAQSTMQNNTVDA